MAKINTNRTDSVMTIKKFLGVNENADGDTRLKLGEASTMTNIKITNDGSLQKRPGTMNVANLLNDYSLDISETVESLTIDASPPNVETTLHPNIEITDGGLLELSGTPVTVNYSNYAAYAEYYYTPGSGLFYQFDEIDYVAASGAGVAISGGIVSLSDVNYSTPVLRMPYGGFFVSYADIQLVSGVVVTAGESVTINVYNENDVYAFPYYSTGGGTYKLTSWHYPGDGYVSFFGRLISVVSSDTYNWNFKPVSIAANSADGQVCGLWAGRVADTEYIVSACNGFLWRLSETDGAWTKEIIGSINTDNPVHMFGYDGKLYLLNGSEYKVWDGTALMSVAGYRPLVAVTTVPAGGGTEYEQTNRITGARRVWFSPDGTTVFKLPETGLASIDYVKDLITGDNYTLTTDYAIDAAAGTVTFVSAPTTGTNTIEIGYTAAEDQRDTVEAMTLSELYNGSNDNRIFIYGDGSNKAYYSDLDYNGQPRPDYFPPLNVVDFGDSNTGITIDFWRSKRIPPIP